MECCRACLSNGNDMIPLDESFISGYNLLTNLNVMLRDGKAQYSCQLCTETVKLYLAFREKCIVSESALQQKLKTSPLDRDLNQTEMGNSNSQYCYLEVKEEMKAEIIDDISIFNDCFDSLQELTGLDYLIKSEVEDDTIPKRSKRIIKKKKDIEQLLDDVKPKKRRAIKDKKIFNEQQLLQDVKPKKRKTKLNEIIEKLTYITCGICVKTFPDQITLTQHLDTHKADSKCQLCPEVFPHWPALFAHRNLHIPNKQHRCYICSKRLTAVKSMEHHYMTLHFEGEKIGLRCNNCERTFATPIQLKKHNWDAHNQKRCICDYCSKVFNHKQRLKSHLKSHSDQKYYVCDLCAFSCKHRSGLRDHMIRKHALEKIYCKNCTRPFPSQKDYDKHKCKIIHKVCPVCGIQIFKPSRMSTHMRVHWEVGKYKCDRCPALYKSKTALSVHIDRHDGVRTHQCEFCPLKFYGRSSLVKHRRVHTGEKPYVCKVCQKGFTGNHNLKVHMKVHGEHLVVKRNKEQTDVTTIFK